MRKEKTFMQDLKETVVIVLIIFVAFKFIWALCIVQGSSMNPTLENGDIYIAQRLGYKPERGDIVVVNTEKHDKTIVKGIIAVGGDVIQADENTGKVILNGKELEEEYITGDRTIISVDGERPITVPEGYVFVMGDNRENSYDSRAFGCVSEEDIEAGLMFKIF